MIMGTMASKGIILSRSIHQKAGSSRQAEVEQNQVGEADIRSAFDPLVDFLLNASLCCIFMLEGPASGRVVQKLEYCMSAEQLPELYPTYSEARRPIGG